jgi:hypothetical protein
MDMDTHGLQLRLFEIKDFIRMPHDNGPVFTEGLFSECHEQLSYLRFRHEPI